MRSGCDMKSMWIRTRRNSKLEVFGIEAVERCIVADFQVSGRSAKMLYFN